MPRKRVGLRDIAEATGYSVNTVSLALRGSSRLLPGTRACILDAASRLHYVPNHVARALVNRRTATIGLVLTDITNPILTQVARSLERELGRLGYALMLAASDNDPDKELQALETFRCHQVDGILIYPTAHRQLQHLSPLRERGYPIVLLAAYPGAAVDVVTTDERAGARSAVRHLLQLGHRRIACIDPGCPLGNREKYDGYREALHEFGLTDCDVILHEAAGDGARSAYDAMAALMAAGPTAVFCATDALALGAVRWCYEAGLRVPTDIAVVGYDNTEAGAYGIVPLTTVGYPVDALSRLAVERLHGLIASEEGFPPPLTDMLVPDLIVRRSTTDWPLPREAKGASVGEPLIDDGRTSGLANADGPERIKAVECGVRPRPG